MNWKEQCKLVSRLIGHTKLYEDGGRPIPDHGFTEEEWDGAYRHQIWWPDYFNLGENLQELIAVLATIEHKGQRLYTMLKGVVHPHGLPLLPKRMEAEGMENIHVVDFNTYSSLTEEIVTESRATLFTSLGDVGLVCNRLARIPELLVKSYTYLNLEINMEEAHWDTTVNSK